MVDVLTVMQPGVTVGLVTQDGQIVPAQSVDFGAIGGGITQLTGDVTAGPGSGSQAATVVGLDHVPILYGVHAFNDLLWYTTSGGNKWVNSAISGDITPSGVSIGVLSVTGLQGTPVNATPPGAEGDVLAFDGTEWSALAPNGVSRISAAPDAAFTTFALGSNLSRKGTGLFRVSATLSGTDSTTETVSVTLVRDGATVIGATMKLPAVNASAATPTFGGSITWTDKITDALAHTWSVNAVGAGGGTLAVATGGVAIEVYEQ